MAFCTNCGAQVSDGTKFCPKCGQTIETEAKTAASAQEGSIQGADQATGAAPVQRSESLRPADTASSKQRKPKNKKTLIFVGIAVLAVVIALVLILALGGKDDKSTVDDPNLGVYTASTAQMLGLEMDVSDMFEHGVTIELKAKGKCAMNVDGTKGNGRWTLEDGVFHISGGGFDCDGTLESGRMTLENMLDMGVTLTLEKEADTRADSNGGDDAAQSDASNDAVQSGESEEAAAVQKQWNGTWYGCMYVRDATGEFSDISKGFYDAYMVVDVDGDGNGQFAVYLANADEAFATASCQATESGLYAVDGTVAGNVDMYAYNWMFLPMPDYPDQYTMGDSIDDGDSLFEYTLFMKQWGGSWQDEVDSDFAIVPPSVDDYHAAINNGELPPIGFAPIDYVGAPASASASGATDSSDTAGDADGESVTLTGEVDAYNYFDEIYVTYPVDSFSVGSVNGLDAIIAKDGSAEISIDVKYTEGGHDYTMQYFDGLSTEQDYQSTNMTIAGYDTRCVTYCDSGRLRPYYACYHVCFKDEGYANYGVNFYVTSADSADACTSDAVLAILNSLTVAK